jgi:hypothetical protein
MTRLFSILAVMETSDAVVAGDLGITNGSYMIEGQDGALVEAGKWTFVGTKVNGQWTTRQSGSASAASVTPPGPRLDLRPPASSRRTIAVSVRGA